MKCENCNCKHDGSYGAGRFCSSKCARGFSTKCKREEINKKVSNKLKGRKLSEDTKKKMKGNHNWLGKTHTEESKKKIGLAVAKYKGKKKIKECKKCKEEKLIAVFGSVCDDCKGDFRVYKELCSFKFNVYNYPDYFDLSLIDKFGWYSASNTKKPNLNGISRDHEISISEGFRLNIDPKIISHIANCKLVRHTINQRKHSKSNLKLNELKLKIAHMSDW